MENFHTFNIHLPFLVSQLMRIHVFRCVQYLISLFKSTAILLYKIGKLFEHNIHMYLYIHRIDTITMHNIMQNMEGWIISYYTTKKGSLLKSKRHQLMKSMLRRLFILAPSRRYFMSGMKYLQQNIRSMSKIKSLQSCLGGKMHRPSMQASQN